MSVDRRSVGELLVANDLIARSVLMDTQELSAREIIRSWPGLTAAADRFWSSLPTTGVDSGTRHDTDLIRQALDTVQPSDVNYGWPGPGPQDMRLTDMTGNFHRGAELLRRFERVEGRQLAVAVVADLDAAETRALHCLYLAAHGVSVALRREQEVLADPKAQRTSPDRRGIPASVARLQERFADVEQALLVHLGRRWPTSLEGEHREQPGELRLREALAVWDVQANRAMCQSPTAVSAYIVCHTQAVVIGNGHALIRAAALHEHIDPLEYRDRLAPALESTAARFRAAGDVWRNMANPSAADPGLHAASREVMAAVGELVSDGAVLASPEALAERVDLREVSQAMRRTLISSAEIAHGVKEAAQAKDLAGPARWVNETAGAAQARLFAANVEPSPTKAWVPPNALRRNEMVALPGVLRDDIAGQMNHVVTAAVSVREAAANVLERDIHLGGRDAQDRAVAQSSPTHSSTISR